MKQLEGQELLIHNGFPYTLFAKKRSYQATYDVYDWCKERNLINQINWAYVESDYVKSDYYVHWVGFKDFENFIEFKLAFGDEYQNG